MQRLAYPSADTEVTGAQRLHTARPQRRLKNLGGQVRTNETTSASRLVLMAVANSTAKFREQVVPRASFGRVIQGRIGTAFRRSPDRESVARSIERARP